MFRWIPFPYKLLAGLALIVAAFLYGYAQGSDKADLQISNLVEQHNKEVADLERINNEISNTVQIEYVDRVNIIREKEYVYRDIIKDSVPTQYTLSNGWVYVHDISTSSGDAEPTRASDASPSGITDTEALDGIVRNYSICEQNAEQLILLQRWIQDNQEAVAQSAREAENK